MTSLFSSSSSQMPTSSDPAMFPSSLSSTVPSILSTPPPITEINRIFYENHTTLRTYQETKKP